MVAEQIARHFVPELIGPTRPDVLGLEVETRAMLEQLRTFSMRVYARGGSLSTFLGHPRSLVDSTLAHLYGIDARAIRHGLRWYDTPDRHGLLTLPAFLVAKAGPTHASIVRRGLFVSERLLCRSVPPQPAGVAVSIPAPLEAETLRRRHARHSTDPARKASRHTFTASTTGHSSASSAPMSICG